MKRVSIERRTVRRRRRPRACDHLCPYCKAEEPWTRFLVRVPRELARRLDNARWRLRYRSRNAIVAAALTTFIDAQNFDPPPDGAPQSTDEALEATTLPSKSEA